MQVNARTRLAIPRAAAGPGAGLEVAGDAAKALGFSQGQQDAWSKQIDGWKSVVAGDQGDPDAHDVPAPVVALAEESMGAAVVLSEQLPQGAVLLEAARSAFIWRTSIGRISLIWQRSRPTIT